MQMKENGEKSQPNKMADNKSKPNKTADKSQKNYKTGGKFKRNNNDLISGGLGHNLQC